MKQIGTEIWKASGSKVFSGKETLVFINRLTGEIKEYECVSSTQEDRFIYDDVNTVDTEEMYGCNGFSRARWVENVISKQSA